MDRKENRIDMYKIRTFWKEKWKNNGLFQYYLWLTEKIDKIISNIFVNFREIKS